MTKPHIGYASVQNARRPFPRWAKLLILIFLLVLAAAALWVILLSVHIWSLGPMGP